MSKTPEEVSSSTFPSVKQNYATAYQPEPPPIPILVIKKQILPVTIYDFNGSLAQYAHLVDTFLDKNALIIVCVDCSRPDDSNLNDLLDILTLKLSKTTSFKILPVLTKCDLIPNAGLIRQACERVESLIDENLCIKLSEIRAELKKIENLSQINASQSDRLKHLAQTQSNLNPDVYGRCMPVGSVKMQGIVELASVIREIVFTPTMSKKTTTFADVNKKVPVFWTEVENYACNQLSEMPSTKTLSENGKFKWTQPQTMNMFCVEFNELKVNFQLKFNLVLRMKEKFNNFIKGKNCGKIRNESFSRADYEIYEW